MTKPAAHPIKVLDAQDCLRDLIDAAVHGQTVLIDCEGSQLVQIVPVGDVKMLHTFAAPGPYITADLFEDDLLSDFEDYR